MRFLPSLTMSVLLNAALFGVLHPIRPGEPRPVPARYRVQRLRRVEVRPPALTPAPPAEPVATPADPPERTPAPRAARTAPAPPPRATRTRPSPGGGDRPRGARGVRATGGPAGGTAPLSGPTGGDGTRRTPIRPQAGGGDPPGAVPAEPGTMTGPPATALGSLPTRAPLGQPEAVRDAPPRLRPVSGLLGGTPTALLPGTEPLPGTAGSGDQPAGVAPATRAGFEAPPVPTTPGEQLRSKPGPGLPGYLAGTVPIPATTVAPRGQSGGGGGTGQTPGHGGGGPPALSGVDRAGDGGGGSGLTRPAQRPGGVALGTGPGGTGGGGNGLGEVGDGIVGTADGTGSRPVASSGAPSILASPGRGVPGAPPVRLGARAAGPGGGPSMASAPSTAAPGPGAGSGGTGSGSGRGSGNGPGSGSGAGGGQGKGTGGGQGGGRGTGSGSGEGSGSHGSAVNRGDQGSGGYTALVVDSLALKWHHYPTSYDLHIGTVNGPRLATIGIFRYPSVASAKSSDRAARNGRHNALVIRPLAIEYIVRDGEGARQRVAISAADADRIKASGLLSERGRILTVWKDNVE